MKNIFILSFVLLSISAYSQDTTKLIPTETQMLVNVSVTNFQNIPRPYEIIIFESVKEKKLYSGKTNAKGKYSLLLPKGDTYLIKYKEFTDSTEYSEFEIPNKPGKYTSELKIQIEPPKTYTLENVFFDTGLSTLKTTSYKSLNDLVEVMKLKPSLII